MYPSWESQSQFEARNRRIRMRVSHLLFLFVLASCPRGTWSETAGLANGTPAKAVHDTISSNVYGANKKNRNVRTTSGPVGLDACIKPTEANAGHEDQTSGSLDPDEAGPVGSDACIQPTEANAGHKDQTSGSLDPDEVLAIDTLELPGLPQQEQIQSRNINLLSSQGLSPLARADQTQ
eukprot:CAMPEP_0185792652 /NCGR_PEP_ID=MMETSP1174-20130828/159054_1 /TAXON_ID=35687 /ORGANISM="Dictyocha speculum, Strain CCMP1381" /LENGTH=178 /DNA_ID=CAMNT_0028487743 /DNA_START=117 /DNA_END=653 /DNA_ORIENTATION=+